MLRLFQGPPDISLHRAPKKLDTALSICPNKLLGLVWTSISLHVVALGWTMIEDLTPITETLPSEVLFETLRSETLNPIFLQSLSANSRA